MESKAYKEDEPLSANIEAFVGENERKKDPSARKPQGQQVAQTDVIAAIFAYVTPQFAMQGHQVLFNTVIHYSFLQVGLRHWSRTLKSVIFYGFLIVPLVLFICFTVAIAVKDIMDPTPPEDLHPKPAAAQIRPQQPAQTQQQPAPANSANQHVRPQTV